MLSEIYLKSPTFVQNIGITMYGAKIYKDRFLGPVPKYYERLPDPFDMSNEDRYLKQEKRLQELLYHCATYVPYYRKQLKGVDITQINANNLHEYLPIITKNDLLQSPEKFISERWGKKRLLKSTTSGSSGTPLEIFSTSEAKRINYSYFNNLLRYFGAHYRDKSTTLAGRVLYEGVQGSPARYDRFNRTQYLSIFNISLGTIKGYIDALNSWKPDYIDSHPSALFEIQYLAEKSGLKLNFSPKFIITSSETLTDDTRKRIETFFNSSVVDHYGCAEMAISAFSKGYKYYVDPAFCVVELNSIGEDLYSLVTTGLLNFGMPLLRYEIGDSVRITDSASPYIFDGIEGRSDDIIITPEGRMVGRISSAFRGIRNLAVAQVIQEKVDVLRVNVVLRDVDQKEFDEDTLIGNLKKRTSEKMKVYVYYKDEIEKGKNGKFKTVISKVNLKC